MKTTRRHFLQTSAVTGILAGSSHPHASGAAQIKSANDKIRIAQRLDDLGLSFIEGGWPGSNPKDVEFFAGTGGSPSIYFLLDNSGSMSRLPPNGAAFYLGSYSTPTNTQTISCNGNVIVSNNAALAIYSAVTNADGDYL